MNAQIFLDETVRTVLQQRAEMEGVEGDSLPLYVEGQKTRDHALREAPAHTEEAYNELTPSTLKNDSPPHLEEAGADFAPSPPKKQRTVSPSRTEEFPTVCAPPFPKPAGLGTNSANELKELQNASATEPDLSEAMDITSPKNNQAVSGRSQAAPTIEEKLDPNPNAVTTAPNSSHSSDFLAGRDTNSRPRNILPGLFSPPSNIPACAKRLDQCPKEDETLHGLSHTEATFEEVATANKAVPGAEFEFDSSPYESSSSDTSDSSDDVGSSGDSDSEGEYEMLSPQAALKKLMAEGALPEEGDDKEGKAATMLRTANEQPEEVIPKPDITITENMMVQELGAVENIVENEVVIKGKRAGENEAVDNGSLLCLQNRSVIGVVADVFGPTQQPFYTVRFTNAAAIKDAEVFQHTRVFYVEQHAKHIFNRSLKAFKGSDASNFYDEEVADDDEEFSDDEQEAEHKRMKKAETRARHAGPQGQANGFSQAPRGGRGRGRGGTRHRGPQRSHVHHPHPRGTHPSSHVSPDAALNYDDNQPSNELYTPLARPANLYGVNGQQGHGPSNYSDGASPQGHLDGSGWDGGNRGYGSVPRYPQNNQYGKTQMMGNGVSQGSYASNTPYTPQDIYHMPQIPHYSQPNYSPSNAFPSHPQQQYQAWQNHPAFQSYMQAQYAAGYPQAQGYGHPPSQHTGYIPPGSHVNPNFFRQQNQGPNHQGQSPSDAKRENPYQ